MTITLEKYGVRIEIATTHHANYWVGATFTWSNGKKTYGEYRSVGDAIKSVTAGRRQNDQT